MSLFWMEYHYQLEKFGFDHFEMVSPMIHQNLLQNTFMDQLFVFCYLQYKFVSLFIFEYGCDFQKNLNSLCYFRKNLIPKMLSGFRIPFLRDSNKDCY